MTKKYKPRKLTISNKKVIISGTDDDLKEYTCPSCLRVIHTRKSQGDLTCPHCLFEFQVEKVRKHSKLETPHKSVEPAISTTPMPGYGDIDIKKKPNYRGSFKTLLEKGIKITSYSTTDGAGRPIREED